MVKSDRFKNVVCTWNLDNGLLSNSVKKASNLNYLILLNNKNAKTVKDLIRQDPEYPDYTTMTYEYIKRHNNDSFPRNNVYHVSTLVRIIDIVNHTDVRIHCKESFDKIINFIVDPNKNFWGRLNSGDIQLVDDLANYAIGKRKNGYYNPLSLASKVCKYISIHEFPGSDNYFIWDEVVRRVLEYYYNFYCNGGSFTKPQNYTQLHKLLLEIQAQNPTLTKDLIDSIMWYCYKK